MKAVDTDAAALASDPSEENCTTTDKVCQLSWIK